MARFSMFVNPSLSSLLLQICKHVWELFTADQSLKICTCISNHCESLILFIDSKQYRLLSLFCLHSLLLTYLYVIKVYYSLPLVHS